MGQTCGYTIVGEQMCRTIISLLTVSLLLSPCVLSADGDGGYAGAFLQVPAGARPTAMGGAYLAVSDDGAAPLFNPAGLALIDKPLFGTSYRAMSLDRTLGYATVAFPVHNYATLGAHWLYAGSGSVEARDSDGYPLGYDLSHNSHQFTILFAKRISDVFAAGTNLCYLHSNMPEMSAYSVGFDFGGMLFLDYLFDREKRDLLPVKDMKLAVTIKNISKIYKWDNNKYNSKHTTSTSLNRSVDDKVPIEFGLGASARFFERKLLFATDFVKNLEQGPAFHAGAEFQAIPEFALRGGYSDGRLTAGTGYLFKIGEHYLGIDYAFSTDRADEGSEHIFSFDLRY